MLHNEYDESYDRKSYKINIEKKEKKHSWSTVLTWLYLKTIGRILPKEWNRWAENILYPVTMSYSNKGFQKNKEVQAEPEVKIAENKELESKIKEEDQKQGDELIPEMKIKDGGAQTDSLLPELEREVEELRKQASNQENLQLEIDRLRAQLEVPPKELLILRDTLQNVKQEREELKEEFSKECERLEGKIKNLQQELAQKVEEIIGLRKEIEKKDEEISELKRENEELNEANERVEAKNIEQQQTIFEKDKRIKELEKALKQKDEEINGLTVSNKRKDEIISEQKQRIEKLENALKQKGGMIRSFTENNKSLKQQVETLGIANQRLEESLQQKEAELEQVKRENNDLKEKVEKLDSTIRGLEDKVKGLEITIDELRVNTQYKDSELKKKREECEALKSEKNDFEQQKQGLEKVTGEKEELEEKVRGLNNTILMLQPKLKELTAKLDETQQLRAQLQNAQESKQRLERENEDFNNRSNTLNEGLERDVIQLKKELEESLTQNSDLRGNNVRLEQLEHDLENQISELKEKLEEEKGQHGEQLEQLNKKLEEAEEGKKRLEEQIEALKEDNAQKWKILTVEEKKGLLAKDAELRRVQTDLSQKNENLNAKFNREKGEVKRLKDIVSQKNDEIRESGERIKKLKEIVDEKEKLLFKARVLVKELESELKKIPGLTNKIEELQKEKVRLEEEKKKSVEVLEETTKELDEQNRLVEELESERKKIPGLTKEVEELQKEKVRLEGEKKQLGEVLDGITKEFDEQKELVEQLQSEQKSKQEQIKGLKRQVAELTGQLKTGEAEAKKLQEEKEELQAKYDNMVATNMNSIKLLNAQNEKLRGGESEEINKLNQELQRVESELKAANKTIARLRKENQAPQREEPEPKQAKIPGLKPQQLKAPKLDQDTVSTTDSGVSSSSSQSIFSEFFSRIVNWPKELLEAVNSLNSFLSRKNKALKGSFPELQGQHFCHTVVEKSVITLSNKNNGRFESKILLAVLESDLNQTARDIVEKKVAEVVNTYYDGGKDINAALRNVTQNYEVLKTKLLSSIEKCIGELKFDVKDPGTMRDSALYKFNERKAGNSDLGALLKGIVVEELVNARMTHFSSKVQEVALNIRDKLLSKQKICEKVPEERNTYQLNSKIVEKYKNLPNSDLGEPSTTKAHVASLPKQSGTKESKKSSTPKPPVSKSDESLATEPKQRGGFLRGLGLFATNR